MYCTNAFRKRVGDAEYARVFSVLVTCPEPSENAIRLRVKVFSIRSVSLARTLRFAPRLSRLPP